MRLGAIGGVGRGGVAGRRCQLLHVVACLDRGPKLLPPRVASVKLAAQSRLMRRHLKRRTRQERGREGEAARLTAGREQQLLVATKLFGSNLDAGVCCMPQGDDAGQPSAVLLAMKRSNRGSSREGSRGSNCPTADSEVGRGVCAVREINKILRAIAKN